MIGGAVLLPLGMIIYAAAPVPRGVDTFNSYGYWSDSIVHVIGGTVAIAGAVALVIAFIRVFRGPRRDPDLPPEHRV